MTTLAFFKAIRDVNDLAVFTVAQCLADPDGSFDLDVHILEGGDRRPILTPLSTPAQRSPCQVWIGRQSDRTTAFDVSHHLQLSPFGCGMISAQKSPS